MPDLIPLFAASIDNARHRSTSAKIRLFSKLALVSTLMTLLSGCFSEPKTVSIGPNDVILAFGDSLTRGTGATLEESYPSELQNYLGVTVINEGIPGETSSEGLKRLESLLQTTRPNLVILCHGGNDILRRKSTQTLEDNLVDMVRLIQSYDAQVLLVAVPGFSLSLSPLPLYQEVADRYDIVIENEALSDLISDPALKSDRVHLNAQGYRLLAEAIGQKISIM